MKAIEMIDNLFTMDDELTSDAAAYILSNLDSNADELDNDEFLHSLAEWATKRSGENVRDILTAIKSKYDADQLATLKEILEVAYKP